jgi:long-chain fatty acid transport protein
MKFDDGKATLTPVAPGADPWGNALVGGLGGSNQKAQAEVNLPDMLQLGIAYRFTPKFRGEFNYVRFGWSTFESLTLDFENDALDQTIDFSYDDSWQIRFGFDYSLNEKWNLMAGYVHDRTPQPLKSVSPILPDTDRNDYSFGVLHRYKSWEFNVSYMYVHNKERTNIENGEPVRSSTTYPIGSYKAHAHLAGIGANFKF